MVASTLKALELAETDRELRPRLQANAQRLYDGLNALGFTTGPKVSPIVAVVMPDMATALGMWNALLAGGVYLNLALPPATPDNRPLLRTSVSAAHTPEQIDEVLSVFEFVGRQLGALPRVSQRASG